MFGLGFSEIIIILIVALLVFGPEKLPELARTLGKTMGQLRRTMDELRSEIAIPEFEFRKAMFEEERKLMATPFQNLEDTCKDANFEKKAIENTTDKNDDTKPQS